MDPPVVTSSDHQLYFPLSHLGGVHCAINQSLIDAEKLLNLLAEPTDVVDAPDAKELAVENGEVEFGACSSTSALDYILILTSSQKMYPSPMA